MKGAAPPVPKDNPRDNRNGGDDTFLKQAEPLNWVVWAHHAVVYRLSDLRNLQSLFDIHLSILRKDQSGPAHRAAAPRWVSRTTHRVSDRRAA